MWKLHFWKIFEPQTSSDLFSFLSTNKSTNISMAKFLGWFAFAEGGGGMGEGWLISSKSSSVETQIHSCCVLRPARGSWDPGKLPDVYSCGKLSFLFLWKAKLFIFVCLFVELWKGSLNETHSRAMKGRMLRDSGEVHSLSLHWW